MIKTILKHFIYEHAINVMFDNINKNFMFANPDVVLQEDKRFSLIECEWLGYRITFHNTKIVKVRYMSLLGIFIELNTTELVHVVDDPTQDVGAVSDAAVKAAFNKCFKPCDECNLKDLYYLINPITIAQMQIKTIQP